MLFCQWMTRPSALHPKPIFFFMQAASEDHVGMMSSLGHEKIDHSEVLQLRQVLRV